MIILDRIENVENYGVCLMIEEILNRCVQSDATHRGSVPPWECSAWLILSGCKDKYFWFGGEWVKSELDDPVKTFKLIPINR